MSAVVQRFLLNTPHHHADTADLVVFVSTTCLCAVGALMLPLVG